MSNRTITLDDPLYQYLLRVSLRETEALWRLREETLALPRSNMQISPEQGQFIAFLMQLIEASRVIEVGTFTGYSTLWMAQALPPEGLIITCDVSDEWTNVARRYWAKAGVANKIDLRLAPALETLDALAADEDIELFDFAFIDADKENYLLYYEAILDLIRPGGLIAVDNVLWNGSVIDFEKQDRATESIRVFNETLHADHRVDISLVPIGDGMTLARKL
jgi:caffeoyl-CoA O-methyltransferase